MDNTSVREIESLLKGVDPTLVAHYEESVLKGTTLSDVIAGCKETDYEIHYKLFRRWEMGLLALQSVAMFGVIYVSDWFRLSTFTTVVAGVAITLLILLANTRNSKKASNNREIFLKNLPLLENFKKAVEGLNPTGRTMREYNEVSIHDELVCLAAWIISAERKFDVIRMQKKRDIPAILDFGNYIETMRDRLSKTSKEAKRFGLVFANKDLFADAEKHLEETYRRAF